jgi:hypothetical protein
MSHNWARGGGDDEIKEDKNPEIRRTRWEQSRTLTTFWSHTPQMGKYIKYDVNNGVWK